MILGLTLQQFTQLHVVISLVAIVAGVTRFMARYPQVGCASGPGSSS